MVNPVQVQVLSAAPEGKEAQASFFYVFITLKFAVSGVVAASSINYTRSPGKRVKTAARGFTDGL